MIFVVIMILVIFFAFCFAICDICGSDNKRHNKSSRRSTPRANRSHCDRGFTSEEFALYQDFRNRQQQRQSSYSSADSDRFYSGDAGDFAAFENGAADRGMVDNERCW